MRERPILFSAPMVRAILEGRKTQTRRLIKPQPNFTEAALAEFQAHARARGISVSDLITAAWLDGWVDVACPYGEPGDRLWVRETWGLVRPGDETDWYRDSMSRWPVHLLRASWDVEHRASWGLNQEACFWRPSIHMPRWASRITLEVTDVRVERLQDITEEDARAEGVEPADDPFGEGRDYWRCYRKNCEGAGECGGVLSGRRSFETLWEVINGRESWDANPWVWIVSFKRVAP